MMQRGDFELHIHIQDGLSSDATLLIAKRWQASLSEDRILGAEKITLTIDSESDNGIYDAIAKGFAKVPASRSSIMTWIGSDDLLTHGSLATVSKIFRDHEEISWLTGSSQTIDATDCLFSPWENILFSRRNIIMGLHDGRTLGFIQQEGTFWRSDLYHRAGGINATLNYAGDFDLWRRFACLEKIYALNFPLGTFRYREKQTSSDKDSYYQEVECLKANFNLDHLCQNLDLNRADEYSYIYLIERFPIAESYKIIRSTNFNFTPLQAFTEQLDPLPEKNMFTTYYWTLGKKSCLRINVFALPIVYRITLKIRNPHKNQLLKIYNHEDKILGSFSLDSNFDKSQEITFEYNFGSGDTTLTLQISKPFNPGLRQNPLGIVIEGLLILPIKYMHQ